MRKQLDDVILIEVLDCTLITPGITWTTQLAMNPLSAGIRRFAPDALLRNRCDDRLISSPWNQILFLKQVVYF